MAGFWGKRKREQEELQAQDDDLARRAEQAIVAADERIRTAADELAFATAELGDEMTADFRAALDAVRVAHGRGVPAAPAEPRRDPRHGRGAAHPQRADRAAVRVGGGSHRREVRRDRRRGEPGAQRAAGRRPGACRRRGAPGQGPAGAGRRRPARDPLLRHGDAARREERGRGRTARRLRDPRRRRVRAPPRWPGATRRRCSRWRPRPRPPGAPRRCSTRSTTSRSRRCAPSPPWPRSWPTPAATWRRCPPHPTLRLSPPPRPCCSRPSTRFRPRVRAAIRSAT